MRCKVIQKIWIPGLVESATIGPTLEWLNGDIIKHTDYCKNVARFINFRNKLYGENSPILPFFHKLQSFNLSNFQRQLFWQRKSQKCWTNPNAPMSWMRCTSATKAKWDQSLSSGGILGRNRKLISSKIWAPICTFVSQEVTWMLSIAKIQPMWKPVSGSIFRTLLAYFLLKYLSRFDRESHGYNVGAQIVTNKF